MNHLVELPYLRLEHFDVREFGRGSGLSKPTYIISYTSRGDHHNCVNMVCVRPTHGGLRDVAFAIPSMKQGKRDKRERTGHSHGFHFIFFGVSSVGTFRPTLEKLLAFIRPCHA